MTVNTTYYNQYIDIKKQTITIDRKDDPTDKPVIFSFAQFKQKYPEGIHLDENQSLEIISDNQGGFLPIIYKSIPTVQKSSVTTLPANASASTWANSDLKYLYQEKVDLKKQTVTLTQVDEQGNSAKPVVISFNDFRKKYPKGLCLDENRKLRITETNSPCIFESSSNPGRTKPVQVNPVQKQTFTTNPITSDKSKTEKKVEPVQPEKITTQPKKTDTVQKPFLNQTQKTQPKQIQQNPQIKQTQQLQKANSKLSDIKHASFTEFEKLSKQDQSKIIKILENEITYEINHPDEKSKTSAYPVCKQLFGDTIRKNLIEMCRREKMLKSKPNLSEKDKLLLDSTCTKPRKLTKENERAILNSYVGRPEEAKKVLDYINNINEHLAGYFKDRPNDSKIFKGLQLDPNLLCALIFQESKNNSFAKSGKDAKGLTQITEDASKNPLNKKNYYFLKSSDDIWTPEKNILTGALTLLNNIRSAKELVATGQYGERDKSGKKLIRKNTVLEIALALYNAGPVYVRSTKGVPDIPETKEQYIPRIMKDYYYRGVLNN